MITRLAGGRVLDPVHGLRGEAPRDLFVQDGRIVAPPPDGRADETLDLAGATVMAGAIDIHTHIAGGKVNLARLMMAEDHRRHVMPARGAARAGGGHVTPTASATARRYAALGYTAAFEPAMVPGNARAAHLEMGDIPALDRGAYVMLGADEYLLRLLARGAPQAQINDYVAWMVTATAALGVKVVNPGGISAFKFNGRRLSIDDPTPVHNVAPRAIIRALARAVHEIGVPHPLHLHCNDLGLPGNVETTLASIDAAEGFPLHLAHAQFHAYGKEGPRGFSSAAARLAEAVNRTPSVSLDVGQVVFGETVTASADEMSQYRNRRHGFPRGKMICMDIECDGACGVLPIRYRDTSFVNGVQWAVGLELFLLVEDPWRIFLTTDHPNGGPFDSYPQLIRLLMDRAWREDHLARLPAAVRDVTLLGTITREYTLDEIAVMTRAAPARILGLADRGHLGPGAVADIAVHPAEGDPDSRFATPLLTLKDGAATQRDGTLVAAPPGCTLALRPEHDRAAVERGLRPFFDRHMSIALDHYGIAPSEFEAAGIALQVIPCRPRQA